ncbi:MAG: TolC family outer membrane protein [Alphaproteobacteria bacterium]|jgi:TolC family type I secretion outer membrane protein|nr:TolC family outer membrane protein [Alphaproteobacteria bacterium]
MKKTSTALLTLVLALMPLSAQAAAQPFEAMMAQAYATHPALKAQEAKVAAVKAGISAARGGYQPSIDAVGGVGRSYQKIAGASPSSGSDTLAPRDMGVTLVQPVFRGFRTTGAVESAQANYQATRAGLRSVEQSVLFQAAAAYLDMLKGRAVLDLVEQNEKVLQEQLTATQERFKVGEVTKTDVSQAQARLSAATAARIAAQGELVNNRARFLRQIGVPPEELSDPVLAFALPSSADEVLQIAQKENPDLIASGLSEKAAKSDITTARGALLPEINIVGTASRSWEQNLSIPERTDQSTIMARVTIPLYRAGVDYAKTDAARQTANQRRFELEEVRQQVKEQALAAWQTLQTTKATIAATESEIEAAQSALYGVKEESKVGSRTTLDILDAQQEALNARVALIRARHDEALAKLSLLAVMGRLTPAALNVPVER